MSFKRTSRTGVASLLAGSLAVLLAACGSSTPSVAPVITTQPANQAVVSGETATFSVTATGTPEPAYQWTRNGTAIAGATSASYTTAATTLGDDGAVFAVAVSNGTAPDATSTGATLTVNPPPGTFDASATTISAGEGVILTYSFPGTATLQEGTGAPVAVTSGGTTVVYPLETTTYTFAWTTGGATFPLTRTVTVKTYSPKHLYVVNVGSNTLSHFTVDMSSFDNPVSPRVGLGVATGADPVHVAATPDERYLYVANKGGASVSGYALDATTGAATALPGSPFTIASDTDPVSSAVSPSGKFLYVGCAASIQVFAIGASGALTAAPSLLVSLPGRTGGDLLMHPSGRFLLVGDTGHGVVKTYAVDATTGALTFASDAAAAGGPHGLAFDRAATHVVTRAGATDAANNAALLTFAVNPYTGALALPSRFEGLDPDYFGNGFAMPYVRGTDNGHHPVAFSRQPGLDLVHDAYVGEDMWPSCFSSYAFDLAAGGIASAGWDVGRGPVPYDPFTTWAGPVYVDFWGSSGDSLVLDRSGTLLVLTGAFGTGRFMNYPVSPDGRLVGGMIGDFARDSGEMGDSPTHAVFTGTLQ